jgi:hypothetical protein
MAAIPPTFVLVIPSTWKTLVKVVDEFGDDVGPVATGYEKYVQSLPKAVLRLEHDSKVRVYHTGTSSQPLCHFENELIRLTHGKELKAVMGVEPVKVNFLLLPTSFQAQAQSPCFKRLRLTLVKTYWNHFHVEGLVGLSEEVKGQGSSAGNSNEVKVGHGLNLYRFEEFAFGVGGKSKSTSDEEFSRVFNFVDEESTLLAYIVNSTLTLLTIFLFIMSFVTFMM